jgi:hypothetical protein
MKNVKNRMKKKRKKMMKNKKTTKKTMKKNKKKKKKMIMMKKKSFSFLCSRITQWSNHSHSFLWSRPLFLGISRTFISSFELKLKSSVENAVLEEGRMVLYVVLPGLR